MDIYCMFPLGFQTPVLIYVQTNRPKRDYTENVLTHFFSLLSEGKKRSRNLDDKGVITLHRGEDSPLPDMIFWVVSRQREKPQRHQFPNLAQTPNSLWM